MHLLRALHAAQVRLELCKRCRPEDVEECIAVFLASAAQLDDQARTLIVRVRFELESGREMCTHQAQQSVNYMGVLGGQEEAPQAMEVDLGV